MVLSPVMVKGVGDDAEVFLDRVLFTINGAGIETKEDNGKLKCW